MRINFIQQFKNFWKLFLYLILILNIVLLLVFGISYFYSIPMEYLLEDPASLYGYNQFVGFITHIGVTVLSTGIGAVLVMIMISPNCDNKRKDQKKEITVIIFLAAISLFFILDDLFLLHERVFTGLLQVGERRIFLIYLTLFAAFLYFFRNKIFSGPTLFFLIAGLLFALSLATDILSDKVSLADAVVDSVDLVEEGSKLGGYLFWTAFIFLRVKSCIQSERLAAD